MKIKLLSVITALTAFMSFVGNAYAMDINYYGDTTSLIQETGINNKLNFEGSVGSQGSNRMATLIIMMPGKNLSHIGNSADVAHFETVSVNYDGTFEFEFNFQKPSQLYNVFIKSDNVSDYVGTYNHKTWDDIKGLFAKINTNPQTLTYPEIEDYSQAMALDLSLISEIYKPTLLKRISAKASEFTAPYDNDDILRIKEIIKTTGEEITELKKIITAENYSHIPAILTKLTQLTGVSYNYGNASQQTVCNALLARTFASAEEVLTAFNMAVTTPPTTPDPPQITGGSGGGGGGGAMPYIPPKEENKEVVNSNNGSAFSDISNVQWAIKPINYLFNKGVINGKEDRLFAPNDKLKREEIVKIIVLGFNITNEGQDIGFTDVDNNQWYAPHIKTAKAAGIVNGVSDDLFGVGSYVTRQDIAVMIYRAAMLQGTGFIKTKTDFIDYENVSEYAKEAVSALAGSGIINGFEDGSFGPYKLATRAEAAKMIYLAIGGDE